MEPLSEDHVPGTLRGKPVGIPKAAEGAGGPKPDRSIRGVARLKSNTFSHPLNKLRHQLTLVVILVIGVLAVLLIVFVAVFQETETQVAIVTSAHSSSAVGYLGWAQFRLVLRIEEAA